MAADGKDHQRFILIFDDQDHDAVSRTIEIWRLFNDIEIFRHLDSIG